MMDTVAALGGLKTCLRVACGNFSRSRADATICQTPCQETSGVGGALHSGRNAANKSFSPTDGVQQGVNSGSVVCGLDDGAYASNNEEVSRIRTGPAAMPTITPPIFAPAPAIDARTSADSQTTAVPSLPPFSKGGATFSGTTSAAAHPHQTADEVIAAEVVDGTQIDGVGFAGTPAIAAPCKCCIM